MQELLGDQVALLARGDRELLDLLGDAPLLVERELHGLDEIREIDLGAFHGRDPDLVVGVEKVLHHHHGVVALLDRLAVEVRGELRQRLRVVVDGDRDVLLRGAELVGDLLVEGVGEPGHRGDSNAGGGPVESPPANRTPRPSSSSIPRRRSASRRAPSTGLRLLRDPLLLETRRSKYDRPIAGIPETLKGRSFTRVSDWSPEELLLALDLADELKVERARRRELRILPGRTVGLIFRKPSTRTRISSEVGIAELGGMALYVPAADLQLARGESTRDTALVLSRFLSAVLIRTFEQAEVDEFAEHASIPVVNGLTDTSHPLQALADAMTIRERFGTLAGTRVTYLGDGNNVCHSLLRIGARTGMRVVAACPDGYLPDPTIVASCREDAVASGGSIDVVSDPLEGVRDAQVLYTDVWTSMGQETERERRLRDLDAFRIDADKLALASPEAMAMHCLPAHVGEEIAEDVLYGERSLVWDQAENRLHAYKSVLALTVR